MSNTTGKGVEGNPNFDITEIHEKIVRANELLRSQLEQMAFYKSEYPSTIDIRIIGVVKRLVTESETILLDYLRMFHPDYNLTNQKQSNEKVFFESKHSG